MKLTWNGDKVLAEFNKLKESAEKQAASNIEQKARSDCPVDTGALKASITMSKSKFKDGGYTVAVGKGLDYASYIELGIPKRPGRPFFRRAAQGEGSNFEKEITTILKAL